ncbi:MAG: adenosylcobinamide-phosphate synthase CbiB [Candidatus Omnitrophota bacterium]|nr:adenosylcobinamide-phosphate synthase CbiB [Candidatus Omnitrophota bacterium]
MRIVYILVSYLLDLVFGDPPSFPHPVRGIGWVIKKLEGPFRYIVKNERIAGVFFACTIIILIWLITFTVTQTAYFFNNYLGAIISIIIIYTSLSVKDLGIESLAVFSALKDGNLNKARTALSKIVGRDTSNLDEWEIIRATVETVAENIVDGIISPLLYAFLGGASLAMAYKAINTLDSMVGYKNKRYINFGWASAKIDDIANFIPARLGVIFLCLASWISGHNPIKAWNIAIRDGAKNPSPNSGLPEAAIAGALGVRLGGLNYYNSTAVQKSYIGDDINSLDKSHIKEAVKIVYITSGLFVITGAVLFWLICKPR